ncbi:MAG: hypothetical protein KAR21_25635 [Spirochaetales bacterium]|nr:hypothetical protein [Spirochaetales bacterium]
MKKKLFGAVFVFAAVISVFADSPLTSTPFYKAYSEVNIIKAAKAKGILNVEMAEYLSSGSISLDLKAALINALSWNFDGKNNSELYSYYLCLKYGFSIENFDISDLSTNELFSLGYLQAMDNYFEVEESLYLLERARENLDKSFTAALIQTLVQAQIMMQSQDWSGIWPMFEELTNDESLKVDIRPEAVGIILDYMVLYK